MRTCVMDTEDRDGGASRAKRRVRKRCITHSYQRNRVSNPGTSDCQFPLRANKNNDKKKRTHEFLESTTLSQSSRQSTLAPSLEANRKAPLNFLFRLYVSLGGGVSLFASMTGIKPLISDVTAAHSVPGPNENGCFVVGRNGTPSDNIDLT